MHRPRVMLALQRTTAADFHRFRTDSDPRELINFRAEIRKCPHESLSIGTAPNAPTRSSGPLAWAEPVWAPSED